MTALRICFVGDSIVNGTYDDACLGWPGRLCAEERAGGHDLTVYNLGIRAETSKQIAVRWRAESAPRLPEPFSGALVFAFGVNDMAEDPGTGIRVPIPESVEVARAMIAEAVAWRPTLWVGPAPGDMAQQPFSPGPGINYSFDNERTAELSRQYAALAKTLGVPYLDLFTPLSGDGRWAAALAAGDGIHPAADGYALIAEHVGAWPAWRAWLD